MIQLITGVIGAIGFAVLYGIRDRRLAAIAAGAALGWGVYLAVIRLGGSVYTGLLGGSTAVALFSEAAARRIRVPVILLLVPMLIPMIPGGDLYRTMSAFVRHDLQGFAALGYRVLFEAGAIALGMIAASIPVHLVTALHSRDNAKAG